MQLIIIQQADPPKIKINKVTRTRQNTTNYIIIHWQQNNTKLISINNIQSDTKTQKKKKQRKTNFTYTHSFNKDASCTMSLNYTHIDSSSNKSITQTFKQNPPTKLNQQINHTRSVALVHLVLLSTWLPRLPRVAATAWVHKSCRRRLGSQSSSCCGRYR